jgi:hypothetical protein
MDKLISTAVKLILLAAIIALAGCNLPAGTRGTPTPVSKSRTSTAAAAQTATAQAVNRKLTQTAAAVPSATLPPPPTDTPPLPTLDLSITEVPPTASATPTATEQAQPTANAYKCGITFISPASGSEIKKGSSFDFKVTFRNDGSATWKPSTVFYIYLSGPKFQKGASEVKLTSDVAPGQLVTLTVDMAANSATGLQNINWGLENNAKIFCYAGVSIVVK